MFLQKIFTPLIALVFIAGTGFPQDINLTLHQDSEMSIEGSSNVRSWGADVKKIDSRFTLRNTDEVNVQNITPEMFETLEITVPVENIDSGSKGLTGNIHKYLKKKDHPNITFILSDVINIEHGDDYVDITARGTINAAGKDHNLIMSVRADQEDSGIRISGTQKLLMTNFDIDPPKAMLGTIKADDEFSVHFNIRFTN